MFLLSGNSKTNVINILKQSRCVRKDRQLLFHLPVEYERLLWNHDGNLFHINCCPLNVNANLYCGFSPKGRLQNPFEISRIENNFQSGLNNLRISGILATVAAHGGAPWLSY